MQRNHPLHTNNSHNNTFELSIRSYEVAISHKSTLTEQLQFRDSLYLFARHKGFDDVEISLNWHALPGKVRIYAIGSLVRVESLIANLKQAYAARDNSTTKTPIQPAVKAATDIKSSPSSLPNLPTNSVAGKSFMPIDKIARRHHRSNDALNSKKRKRAENDKSRMPTGGGEEITKEAQFAAAAKKTFFGSSSTGSSLLHSRQKQDRSVTHTPMATNTIPSARIQHHPVIQTLPTPAPENDRPLPLQPYSTSTPGLLFGLTNQMPMESKEEMRRIITNIVLSRRPS